MLLTIKIRCLIVIRFRSYSRSILGYHNLPSHLYLSIQTNLIKTFQILLQTTHYSSINQVNQVWPEAKQTSKQYLYFIQFSEAFGSVTAILILYSVEGAFIVIIPNNTVINNHGNIQSNRNQYQSLKEQSYNLGESNL